MVRAYLNVRATGGAVKPFSNDWKRVWEKVRSPFLGQEGVGVDVTLQGKTLQKGGLGDIPLQGKALLDAAFTQGYNTPYTTPQKLVAPPST